MTARYDAVAESYAASGDNYEGSAVSALLELVGPHPGPRALDLACGHGPLARELTRRGARVTAVDVSRELLDRARAWNLHGELPIEYVHGSATDEKLLRGEMFDLVVSNFGLSDIDDLDAISRVIARLLVAGGRFVFSILHPCFAGAARVSLGRDAQELGVVARLIVDPAARRRGAARALLETAAGGARERGLHPILDVVTHYEAAIALYRSCGWRNVGEVEMVFGDDTRLSSYVYVAPTT